MAGYTIVNAVAPIRVCDIGGWTDTWFSGSGAIFNIAVYPYAEVQVHCSPELDSSDRVGLTVENFGDTYLVDRSTSDYCKHPLLEAFESTFTQMHLQGLPPGHLPRFRSR